MVFLLFYKNADRPKWVIFLLLLVSFGTDLYNKQSSSQHISNQWAANTYTLVEGVLLFLFYILILRQKVTNNIATLALISFLLVWIWINVIKKQIALFDTVSIGVEATLLILLSIIFFNEKIRRPDATFFIYASPTFWIVIAFLIYAAGTFFLFLYFESLSTTVYSLINAAFLILKNLLVAVGFILKEPAEKKSKLRSKVYDV